MANKKLRQEIITVVTNQIESGTPPQAKATFERLLQLGYKAYEAKQLIGQCVAVEIFHILKHQEPFNEEQYIKNLENLPEEPLDSEAP